MTYPYQPGPPEQPPPADPPPVYYYPPPMYAYPYQQRRPVEGLAIASLVVSCAAALGLCAYGVGGILGVVGAILGHAARRRIRINGNDGAGLAQAGIIVGWIMAGIALLAIATIVVLIVATAQDSSY